MSRDDEKDLAALLEAHAKEIEEAEQALLDEAEQERQGPKAKKKTTKHQRLAGIKSNIDEVWDHIDKPAVKPAQRRPRPRPRTRTG